MLLRYPGSKRKLSGKILGLAFPEDAVLELWSLSLPLYCEPFFGSGAIGWDVLRSLASPNTDVIVNDADPGIAAMWRAVRDSPRELISLVHRFRPSADLFYKYKDEDGRPDIDPVELGFRKLALHQMSFSGLGYKAGGPLGGRNQASQYTPHCRWNPKRIAGDVVSCHKLAASFRHFDIRNEDFAETLGRVCPNGFAYIDPPYYVQGEALYRYFMTEADHVRLAGVLRRASFRWVLSYDDHPHVRELYSWARIGSFEMTPTVQTSREKRRKNSEIVITNIGTN